jgi:hypothetical protein
MNCGQAETMFPGTASDRRRGFRRGRGAITFALLVAFASACGSTSFPQAATTPTSTRTQPTRLPAGYVRFVDTKDGFSIAVPRSWRRIDPSSPGASAALRGMLQANPNVQAAIGSKAADVITQGTKFMTLNLNGRAGIPTLNVIVEPAVGARDSDLPDVANSIKGQYAKAGATVEGTRFVSLAGHRALEVLVTFHLARPTGEPFVKQSVQDFVVANDSVYIVSRSGTSPDLGTIVSTFNVL